MRAYSLALSHSLCLSHWLQLEGAEGSLSPPPPLPDHDGAVSRETAAVLEMPGAAGASNLTDMGVTGVTGTLVPDVPGVHGVEGWESGLVPSAKKSRCRRTRSA
jgi:hypothetical protein